MRLAMTVLVFNPQHYMGLQASVSKIHSLHRKRPLLMDHHESLAQRNMTFQADSTLELKDGLPKLRENNISCSWCCMSCQCSDKMQLIHPEPRSAHQLSPALSKSNGFAASGCCDSDCADKPGGARACNHMCKSIINDHAQYSCRSCRA